MQIEIREINESPSINKADIYISGTFVGSLFFGEADLIETESEMRKIADLIESQLAHKTFPK